MVTNLLRGPPLKLEVLGFVAHESHNRSLVGSVWPCLDYPGELGTKAPL